MAPCPTPAARIAAAPSSPRTSPITKTSARVRNVWGINPAGVIPCHFDVTGSRACISWVQRRPSETIPNSKSDSTVTIRVVSGYASNIARSTVVLPDPCGPVRHALSCASGTTVLSM